MSDPLRRLAHILQTAQWLQGSSCTMRMISCVLSHGVERGGGGEKESVYESIITHNASIYSGPIRF